MINNNKISIGTFVQRFENIYGDIRNNRKTFSSAFNKYYSQRFDWHMYDYYVRIPNHTHIEFDSMQMDRTLTQLVNKHIHEECNGVIAYRKITA